METPWHPKLHLFRFWPMDYMTYASKSHDIHHTACFDPNLTTPKMGVRIIFMTRAWACGQPAVVGAALSKKKGENGRFDRFIGLQTFNMELL